MASSLQLVLLVLYLSSYPALSLETEAGSGCGDWCVDEEEDGSGDGDDVFPETPRGTTPGTVCRSTDLITWEPEGRDFVPDDTAYRMVQSCPQLPKQGDTTVSRCQVEQYNILIDDMSLILPVTSASSNVTYFNQYCFLCSGDVGPSITWSINVTCSQWVGLQSLDSERQVLQAALQSEHCSAKLRPHSKATPETCDVNDDDDSYFLRTKPPLDKPQGLDFHPKGAPLSLLLRFRDTPPPISIAEGSDHKIIEPSAAADGECLGLRVQNSKKIMCLALNCSEGKHLEEHTCQPVISYSRGLHYAITMEMSVFVDRDEIEAEMMSYAVSSRCSLEQLIKRGVSQHAKRIHSQAYNLTGWILSGHTGPSDGVLSGEEKNVDDLYFEEKASTTQHGDIAVEGGEKLLGEILLWLDIIVTSNSERNRIENEIRRMTQSDWTVVCGNTHSRIVPTLTNHRVSGQKYRDPASFMHAETHSDYASFLANSNPMVVSPFLFCPFLVFPQEEYTFENSLLEAPGKEKALNLTLMNMTAVIPSSEIDVDDAGNLKICKILFEEKFHELMIVDGKDGITGMGGSNKLTYWSLMEHYLSLICVCLSLASLLATLLTYSLFRSLRTIPGQNTMALCANLFLAQATLQFGINWTELKGGCVAIGVLVHYFWLASVLWMNVCSFHMHRVFTSMRAARMTSTHVKCCTGRVVAYAVYAQGVPLVVIGATASTSLLLSGGSRVGYGGEVCYLSSPFLVGVAFAAPLGAVLVLNLAFFLGAVREIAKTEKPLQQTPGGSPPPAQNGAVRSPSPSPSPSPGHAPPLPSSWRRNLYVSIRLSSLTGFFWTLGLLAAVLDLSALRLASVLFNGSQGVLIAASYLPTRRVARLYSQACCTCRPHKRRSASITPPGNENGISGATSTTAVTLSAHSNGCLQISHV